MTKKILRTAGKRIAKKPKPFASKKHCEVKKNNPKISMKFSGNFLGLSVD
jgi:hypothetical protein